MFLCLRKTRLSYDDWNTKVEFRGNGAPAVFATTLMNCAVGSEERSDGHNRILEWPFVKFFYKNGSMSNVTREFSTDPVHITYRKTDWDVSPGQVSIIYDTLLRYGPYHPPRSVNCDVETVLE